MNNIIRRGLLINVGTLKTKSLKRLKVLRCKINFVRAYSYYLQTIRCRIMCRKKINWKFHSSTIRIFQKSFDYSNIEITLNIFWIIIAKHVLLVPANVWFLFGWTIICFIYGWNHWHDNINMIVHHGIHIVLSELFSLHDYVSSPTLRVNSSSTRTLFTYVLRTVRRVAEPVIFRRVAGRVISRSTKIVLCDVSVLCLVILAFTGISAMVCTKSETKTWHYVIPLNNDILLWIIIIWFVFFFCLLVFITLKLSVGFLEL